MAVCGPLDAADDHAGGKYDPDGLNGVDRLAGEYAVGAVRS